MNYNNELAIGRFTFHEVGCQESSFQLDVDPRRSCQQLCNLRPYQLEMEILTPGWSFYLCV
jgi:hypothetical protein